MTTARQSEAGDGELIAALTAVDTAAQHRLHARLVAAANDAGILDVAYRTIDTPVGKLLVARTAQGLVRVAYAREDHERVLEQLAQRVSPRVLRAPARLDLVASQLEEYFTGQRNHFELPLDLQLAHGFRRAVLLQLRQIAYGTTASYTAIAAATGKPKAVRAVGTACATNPLPVVVPCHRVVRSDGTVGQYVGGSAVKQALLTLEAA